MRTSTPACVRAFLLDLCPRTCVLCDCACGVGIVFFYFCCFVVLFFLCFFVFSVSFCARSRVLRVRAHLHVSMPACSLSACVRTCCGPARVVLALSFFIFYFFVFLFLFLFSRALCVCVRCAYEHTCLRTCMPACSLSAYVRAVSLRVWCWHCLFLFFCFVVLFVFLFYLLFLFVCALCACVARTSTPVCVQACLLALCTRVCVRAVGLRAWC